MIDRLQRSSCAFARALLVAVVFAHPTVSQAHDGIAGQIARLSAQIAQEPASAELLVRRADLYRRCREWTLALADLDRAEQLDRSLAAVNLVRGQVFLGQGRHPEANQAATKFLVAHPQHIEALIVRARARMALGSTRGAIVDFTNALELRPLPEVYVERARALATTTAGVPDAISGLDEGIARIGSIVSLELEAISYEIRLRRFDQALSRIDRIIGRSSRHETWLARRGEILEAAGRIDEARAAYAAALDAASQLPPAKQQTRATSLLITRLRAGIGRLQGDRGIQKQGQ